MNKAQNVFEKVKRHQFWILCGLVSLVGLVSWWLATGSLADTYAKNKSKVESEANKIVGVVGIADHPNEEWNKKVASVVEKDRKVVEKAWGLLYSEQKSKVYVWPANVLGQDFVDYVQNLRPGEELPPELLNRYWNEVRKQFEELATLIDAEYLDPTRNTAGLERSTAAPPVLGATAEPTHKVMWNGQLELQKPYMWEQRPTTQQVLYAQEEIWVMRAIFQAIAKANEDSAGAHDAAVRTIEDLAVGYLAAEEFPNGMRESGRVTRVKAPAAAAGGYGAVGGGDAAAGSGEGGGLTAAPGSGGLPRPPRPDMAVSGGGGGYGATGSSESAAPAASTNPDDYLKEWRYVDGNSKPLTAAELASPPFYEYRLMPWRVSMTVDRGKWDELLVMFRNTDLPLAIRQVRVNPANGAVSIGGGGGREGGRTGGGYGRGGGYGAARAGGGGYGRGRESRGGYGTDRGGAAFMPGMQDAEQTITLELRGVAYLINPPDNSKIGVSGASAPLPDASAASAPAATAASAPATPAPPSDSNPFGAPVQAGPAPAARPGAGYGAGR